MEAASKSSHGHVIRDASVQAFLETCKLPKTVDDINLTGDLQHVYKPVPDDPIRIVVAIDGGYTEIPVRTEFPSATICFFQFGALFFSVEDLERIEDQPFIDPDDMSKLKEIQRLKFTLPVRNITVGSEPTLTHSVRKALYDFFRKDLDEGGSLMDTLRWLVFEEYAGGKSEWILATSPYEDGGVRIPLCRQEMTAEHTWHTSEGPIYLTDVFRLHEAIDDEMGAGGTLGYVTTTIEQIVMAHVIRLILNKKPSLLSHTLFIKDGPLAFFGQTANMHKPMRALVRHLFMYHDLFMAGLEKSGEFVEHADEVAKCLDPGIILIPDNAYIYRYIMPGKADPTKPYGRTTYYGNKLIFKTRADSVYVVSVPTTQVTPDPKKEDLRNLDTILTNVEKLKCDMYDSALMPVALANKLVSLANHPSSKILHRFAVGSVSA